jgi:hypothetical protein
MRSFRPLALLVAVTAALVACGPPRFTEDAAALDVARPDGGGMDSVASDATPDVQLLAERCLSDNECDDGLYCNGRERCASGVCALGTPPCEDSASCTMNGCDEENDRCTTVADHSMCGDRNACNGIEQCNPRGAGADPRTGCTPVRPENVIDCDDSNNCTIDSCDSTVGCVHSPRDLDGDGFVDRACTSDGLPSGVPGTDCNDSDPLVYPGAVEDCFDGRDNNCNSQADFFDVAAACRATNDTCATARLLPGPGTYNVALTGVTNNYTLSCNTATANDVVFRFRLDAPQDVRVTMASTDTGSAIAVASSCDMTTISERSCGRVTTAGAMTASPAIFLRALPAGDHFIVLEAAGAGPYRFSLRFEPPTMFPAGDACPPGSPPADLALGAGMPGAASTVTPTMLGDDFGLACNPGLPRPDGMLRFSLTDTRNVDLNVSSTTGVNYVSVRRRGAGGSCPGTQIRCQATPSSAPYTVSLRDLPADEYYVIIENSVDAAVTVTATSSDPSMRAPGDACRSAINIPIPAARPTTQMGTTDFSAFLADADHGVSASCGSRGMPAGWYDGVYSFAIAEETDVRIVVRPTAGWAPSYVWGVQSSCGTPASVVGRCNTGSAATVFYTGLAAGTYSLVVETQTRAAAGQGFTVTVEAISPASRPREEACSGLPIPLVANGANLEGSYTFDPRTPAPSGLNPNPDHGTLCGSGGALGFTDVAFSFTIPDSRQVTVELNPTASGVYWFELQNACATNNLARCYEAFPRTMPMVARPQFSGRLAAGTYFLVAETQTTGRVPATFTIVAAP